MTSTYHRIAQPLAGESCAIGGPKISKDPIVLVDKLSYQYPRSPEPVLRNINLSIRPGEFLGIVGPTGAGKTTLCLAMNGIVPQFYGGRFFGGVRVTGLDTIETPTHVLARQAAIVLQDPETQLIANSVEDEVAFGLENLCLDRQTILSRIDWALDIVRLRGMHKKHPSELSGGEKQRLAIAAALAMQPKLLILDEPTSQLDPQGAQQVFVTARDLNKNLGMTIVLVSHATEELAEHADRIALLDGGQLEAIGPPGEVLDQPDLITRHSVRPPQVTRFFQHVRDRGLFSGQAPTTLAQAKTQYDRMHGRVAVRPAVWQVRPHDSPQTPALLSARSLTHTFPDGTPALHDVTLDVHRGEYLVIVGQNGAGKTTLVKHFLHLLNATSGEVLWDGQDVARLAVHELAQCIGLVMQNPDNQIFSTTVQGEVAFALSGLGIERAEVKERVDESLMQMGLIEYRDWHPLSLAKGDRARVVIAAVLAMRPQVLVFDEPTTGQDYAGAMRILNISRELHRAGKTVVVITHHLHLMPGYAERVVVMGKGAILLDGPIREVYRRTDVLGKTFLTPPQIVQLAAHIEAREGITLPILTPEELVECIRAAGASA